LNAQVGSLSYEKNNRKTVSVPIRERESATRKGYCSPIKEI